MSIRTVLFDLGNVLLDFSHEKMCQQVSELISVSQTDVKLVFFESGLSFKFETGELTESEVHQHLERAFHQSCTIEQLREAVGDIFTPKVEMEAIVQSLRGQGIRLVLMSNTCETHIEWIRQTYTILNEFDHLVLSYEVGACKPDESIYKSALKHINCLPEECFYTDDIAEYVLKARSLGINAEVFTGSTKLNSDFKKYGLKV